jgi:ribosome biogenesis GTPase / thiamine phosphate phosphatase
MAKTRNYDGENVRIRPSRSSRPRSKDRPDYSKSVTALVIAVDRGRTSCLIEASGTVVTAMKARELGKQSVVVGDLVKLDGDISGDIGTLARVVTVAPRKNELSRTVDDSEKVEKRIVANIDQMAIVVAAKNPEPRHGFVDRALVIAFDQGIKPMLIVTKTDLGNGDEFLKPYEDLEVEIFKTKSLNTEAKSSLFKGDPLKNLRAELTGKVTVLLGHSGVGKSTLVNILSKGSAREIGEVNDVTGRGRHTSSSAVALELNPGWIIDTPGVRSFGVAHINPERVISSFPEFEQVIKHCPKNCSHDEASCALNDANYNKTLSDKSKSRLESLRRMLSAAS